jgi:NitT/TauT family transport system ATP-binding protein
LSRLRHWSSAWTTYAPFITHDVGEAVFISDRVIAMTRRPGRVKRDERIKAPKPRDYDFLGSPEFIEHEHELVLAVQSEVDPDGVKDKAA